MAGERLCPEKNDVNAEGCEQGSARDAHTEEQGGKGVSHDIKHGLI